MSHPLSTDPLPAKDHVPLQYSDATGHVTTEPDEATEATLFTVDAEVIVHLAKTRQGGWRTEYSDHWIFTRREERTRWTTPQEALADLSAARHVRLNEITHV